MRYSTALLAALPTFATAVTLNDFPPRLTDLSPACKKLYTQEVQGCKASDFTSGKCSVACINGLNELVAPIQQSCQGEGGQNVISAFLANDGPSSLCTNAGAVLGDGGSSDTTSAAATTSQAATTATTAATTSSSAAETTTASSTTALTTTSSAVAESSTTSTQSSESSTSSAPTSSTSVELSGTTTAASLSTTSSILFDTSISPTATDSQSSTATSESSPEQSMMNDGSGGGSPFDSTGNVRNAAGRTSEAVSMLAFIMPAVAMLAFNVDWR